MDNDDQLQEIASTLTDLGSSCRALNDDEKALICFQQASAMYQSTKTVSINQDWRTLLKNSIRITPKLH